MKIIKINSKKDCGGFQKPKGKLDTQLYPECKDTKYDRDVVKKHRKRKKSTTAKKKKEYKYNPWAVCNTTVDKEKDPEKFERCVKKVKKQQEQNKKSCFVCSLINKNC